MPTCFVMQPFDGAEFDRRFKETFSPAIEAAGLEAYRVDQDPKVSIPIQDIEAGIRDSLVCLADITKDNPNVWFELGFAIACKKQVVLVCSDERTAPHFPFDVQHRSIVRYSTKSPSDYVALGSKITDKLKAYLENAAALQAASEAPMLTDITIAACEVTLRSFIHVLERQRMWSAIVVVLPPTYKRRCSLGAPLVYPSKYATHPKVPESG